MEIHKELVLVFDCGATNLKVLGVNPNGEIVAHASRPNSPRPQVDGKPGWLIWDLQEIWRKLCEGAQGVSKTVGSENIRAVIVTTWGADGAPVRRDGTLTYPPISWQCARTQEIAKKIEEKISAWEIFQITGYQIIPFNTLFRLIWLKENVPKALREAYTWLMMPGLLTYKLSSKVHIDPTSASTMMAMDLKKRDWSESLLEFAGLDQSFFPEWHEPGEVVGYITEEAEKQCGIPTGVPVVAGGHDTQFALFGSGDKRGDAILSSGTWEILGVRMNSFNPSWVGFEEGLIIEADVQHGLWNPQLLMIGSAVLEWVLDKFFPGLGEQKYEVMMKEAANVPPGSGGVTLIPSFVKEIGPTKKFGTMGTVLGLTLQTSRGQILRAALEGLSFQLKEALRILIEATSISVNGIHVVGGGAKNVLWNQMRADITGLPIAATKQEEVTALGAALTAFIGIDRYKSLTEARKYVFSEEKLFKPGSNRESYETIFQRYTEALQSLRIIYQRETIS